MQDGRVESGKGPFGGFRHQSFFDPLGNEPSFSRHGDLVFMTERAFRRYEFPLSMAGGMEAVSTVQTSGYGLLFYSLQGFQADATAAIFHSVNVAREQSDCAGSVFLSSSDPSLAVKTLLLDKRSLARNLGPSLARQTLHAATNRGRIHGV